MGVVGCSLSGGLNVAVLAALHLRPDAGGKLVLALAGAAPRHARLVRLPTVLPIWIAPPACGTCVDASRHIGPPHNPRQPDLTRWHCHIEKDALKGRNYCCDAA